MDRTRRAVLGATVAALSGAVAGCAGDGGGDGDTATTTTESTTTTTQTTTASTPTTTATTTTETTTTESTTSTTTTTTPAPEVTVEMAASAFDPVRADVAVGTTVVWTNRDPYGHTVESARFHETAADWAFETETLGQGDTAAYTFETAGVYEYFCTIHGRDNMCGAVLVGDVSLSKTLPCEGDGNTY
ncbi:MAG: plastocyanin/azurin family copper-binding protein [Halobacteriaceae archaeon]